MRRFRFPLLRELTRQLLLGPRAVRLRQVEHLEALLTDLDPGRPYPYEFLYFRITRYRPKEAVLETYTGADVLPDLARALDMLSGSVPRATAEVGEKVYKVEEVCRRQQVSERTLRRWRRRSLVSAQFRFPDGQVRRGIRQSALDTFTRRHASLVRRAGRFSRLSEATALEAVAQARRYAADEGLSLTAAARRIAQQSGRAEETIRQLLIRHDQDNPSVPIFAGPRGRLSAEARRAIYSAARQGTPVNAICRRYGRSRASVYRVINQERARQLATQALTYHPDDELTDASAEARLLGPDFRRLMERVDRLLGPAGPRRAGTGPGPTPVTAAEEASLFRAYNYAKFRAEELRQELAPRRYVPSRLLNEVVAAYRVVTEIRDRLVRLHMPMVAVLARQHTGPAGAQETLLRRGRSELLRLIDAFPCGGRVRFGAYAGLELMKSFAKAAPSADL